MSHLKFQLNRSRDWPVLHHRQRIRRRLSRRHQVEEKGSQVLRDCRGHLRDQPALPQGLYLRVGWLSRRWSDHRVDARLDVRLYRVADRFLFLL